MTNVMVDGRLWGAIQDGILVENLGEDPTRIREWAENVVRNLLAYLRDGIDVWDPGLADKKFDFLMRCAP